MNSTGNIIIDTILFTVGNVIMFGAMSVQAFLMDPAAFIAAVLGVM